MQTSSESESWSFTIIRSQGLGPLRPDKSWRPIVTVAFDQQHHEIVLGSDGQNPNLKKPFYIRHTDSKSQVDLNVWHQSQSKRKGRKRNPVASARLSLVELLKKQGSDARCEVRLSCLPTKQSRNGRGKQQNGACLYVKICPPASYLSLSQTSMQHDIDHDALSDPYSSGNDSDTIPPTTPTMTDSILIEASGVERQKLKRRSVRGYSIDTDEDDVSDARSSDDDFDDYCFVEEKFSTQPPFDSECLEDVIDVPPASAGPWMAASLLPRYVDQASIISTMSVAESTVSCITSYRELRDASVDTDFEKIRAAMQFEWCFVGGIHVALAGLAAAVFGFSPGSIFAVTNPFAKDAVSVAGVSSAFGLSVTAWLLLRYGGSDITRFQRVALDVYKTYFFFSITSRIPAFCLLISAVALLGFMVQVAYGTWPTATIVMSFIGGILCGLQYLAWVLHTIALLIFRALRAIRKGIERICTWALGIRTETLSDNSTSHDLSAPNSPPSEPPTQMQHP